MQTPVTALFVCALTLGPAIVSAQPQSGGPQTYSITATNSMMAEGMVLKIDRDGSRESLEQTVPASAAGPGMHMRTIYDFGAHRLWAIDLTGRPCTTVAYTSATVPSLYDPFVAAAEVNAGLNQMKPAVLRKETINGIATKVYEMPDAGGQGKTRLWLEEKLNFPVKMTMVAGNGPERTLMEVRSVSYAKPSADLFVPPQNCQALTGETNATGGRVEMSVETPPSAQKAGGEPPAQQGAARPAAQAPAPAAGVATVEIRGAGVSPLNYDGPAPAVYQFNFEIEASGPVEAQWVLVSQANTAWASGKLAFEAAGTQTLNVPVKIGTSNGKHWEGAGHLEVVAGGKKVSSVKMEISADCRAK